MSLQGSNKTSAPFELVAPYYDELMESVPYRFWLKYLHTVWDRHHHRPQNILDLACGTGTMSLMLAQEGLLVTGVDISERMLSEAAKKSGAAGIYVNYIRQDASELDLDPLVFDTAISLFDSLNNIIDPDALAECFCRVRRHLAPPGLFLFDVNTAYAFRQGMFDQKSDGSSGSLQYRWRSSYDETDQLCTVQMNFSYKLPSGVPQTFEEVHVQRAYTTEEIEKMLRDAGFDTVTSYDAYSLKPPKRRSDRIFYVAQTV